MPVFVEGKDVRGQDFKDFTAALDVSACGMLVVIQRYLPLGSKVSIEVPVPPLVRAESRMRYRPRLRTKLVRSAFLGQYRLYGAEFQRPLLTRPKPGRKNFSAKRKKSSPRV